MTEKQKRAKIAKVMGEFKRGELRSSSGKPVTNRKQALAIAFSYFEDMGDDHPGVFPGDLYEPYDFLMQTFFPPTAARVFFTDDYIDNNEKSMALEDRDSSLDKEFPKVEGNTICGLEVLKAIPNIGSIAGAFSEYEILQGIRKISYDGWSFPRTIPNDIQKLMDEIKSSGKIKPLIVGVSGDDVDIIEGSHRVDALYYLGCSEFPAVVVVDTSLDYKESSMAEGRGVADEDEEAEHDRLLAEQEEERHKLWEHLGELRDAIKAWCEDRGYVLKAKHSSDMWDALVPSAYFRIIDQNDDDIHITLRISDHPQARGGGYSLERGDRYGESDVSFYLTSASAPFPDFGVIETAMEAERENLRRLTEEYREDRRFDILMEASILDPQRIDQQKIDAEQQQAQKELEQEEYLREKNSNQVLIPNMEYESRNRDRLLGAYHPQPIRPKADETLDKRTDNRFNYLKEFYTEDKTYLEFTKTDLLKGVDGQFRRNDLHYDDLKKKVGSGGVYIQAVYPKYIDFKVKSASHPGFYDDRLYFSEAMQYIVDNFKFMDYDVNKEEDQKRLVDDVRDYMKDIITNGDIRVSCNCPDFLYAGYKYIGTEMDYNRKDDPERRFPKVNNPGLKGVICKHLRLVLNKLGDASTLNIVVNGMTRKFLESQISRRYKAAKRPDFWKKLV